MIRSRVFEKFWKIIITMIQVKIYENYEEKRILEINTIIT